MNILGLCGGRLLGNSEILLKEALMGAEETGATVEIIRLMDVNIKPPLGDGAPVSKDDDFAFLNKKILNCDGIILSAPTYSLTLPGFISSMRDRVSIRHSVPSRPKMAGLIGIGGTDWVGLMLPTMYLFLPQGHVKMVDQILYTQTSLLGHAVLNDKAIARARKLGQNIGKAVLMPTEEVQYVGDEYWTCPICKQNLLKIRGKFVECPICDVRGKIEVKGDEIKFVFTEEDLKTYRWGHEGLQRHTEMLKVNNAIDPAKEAIVKEKSKKYADYKPFTVPPSKGG